MNDGNYNSIEHIFNTIRNEEFINQLKSIENKYINDKIETEGITAVEAKALKHVRKQIEIEFKEIERRYKKLNNMQLSS